MTFESKPEVSKAIAIFCVALAVVFAYFGIFVASGAGRLMVIAIALTAAFASVVAYTARVAVAMDRTAGLATRNLSSVLGRRSWQYPLSAFNTVAIQSGGRGAFGEPIVVYFVALTGKSTLRITAATSERTATEADAQAIADYLELRIRD